MFQPTPVGSKIESFAKHKVFTVLEVKLKFSSHWVGIVGWNT